MLNRLIMIYREQKREKEIQKQKEEDAKFRKEYGIEYNDGIETMNGQAMANALTRHFMGTDYYYVGPSTNAQGNPIVLREIIKTYPHPIHQKPIRWGFIYKIYKILKYKFN